MRANKRAAASAACLGSQSMPRTCSLAAGVLEHGAEQIAALGLDGRQPLGVGLLAEGGARALEGRQHAGRIDRWLPSASPLGGLRPP